ncbi:MAG: GNAT family N-acetyltransferase [Alphaproteobacteria bacterium]|nr:GNAT family N-acetyltransferase [Alphaproteobacteria bacterium]
MASVPHIEGFTARALEERDVPALQTLFDEDPEYFELNGRAFPVEEVRDALPPGRTAGDKFLFVLERNGRAEGMIDFIRDYPEPHIWHLGFIFLSKAARGGGAGRRCLRALFHWVRAQGGTVIRLGVVEPNAKARHLYATEGFEFEAVREVDPAAKRLRRTLVLRRTL